MPVIRRTLAALAQEAHVEGPERRLHLGSGVECSVVYFRCGYTPDDYPTDAQWDARRRLERSIKRDDRQRWERYQIRKAVGDPAPNPIDEPPEEDADGRLGPRGYAEA